MTHPPSPSIGLGKLGGIALGYGSDMELLFVYDTDPNAKTTGGKRGSIAASEYFELLAKEAAQFIRARRGGIFEADLRLRPYGKDSPLAASAQRFASYYGPDGRAHPFERLALVRLRWIAGSPDLGNRIEQLRDRFVYDHPAGTLDLDALWDVWGRSRRERLEASERFNAKHSPGALTDLESALQLLQVMHARRVPQLRTPRLSRAMEALRLGGVITTREYEQVIGAYHFFRRLVNALRMLRGSAADLLLPTAETLELKHLARRMGYRLRDEADAAPPDERLLRDCQRHADAVRHFVEHHFARPVP